MTMTREELVPRISDLLRGRPVRWAGPRQAVGDYDGRDRTLEVFNANPSEQRELLRCLRPIRKELEVSAGGPVIVLFHTRAESARLYADFVEQSLRAESAANVASAERDLVDPLAPLATDVRLDPGSSVLPRRAA